MKSQKRLQPEPLILASSSPRRRELLAEAGYTFEVVSPPLDEPDDALRARDPYSFTESLAFFKASSVARAYQSATILGADTMAWLNGRVVGKPVDRDDARRMLKAMSGTTHEVVTGVALVDERCDRRIIAHDRTMVVVRQLSDVEIEDYLDTDQWRGKAGGYGIQDVGDDFVERIEGSFSNVVGMPLEKLTKVLRAWVT